MDQTDNQFSEKDIQAAMRYLKSKGEDNVTREDAIELLQDMGDTAHMIAEMAVESEKQD